MEIIRPKSKQPMPVNAKLVFKGAIFDVYQWEQEMFDGSVATFEKLRRADTVIVYPILPDGKILLTEQEQPGKAAFIGATGGRVDEGEDILAAAKRELLEESGYEADRLILWEAVQPVGKIDWAVFTFLAKGLTKVADLNLDAGEKITLKPVTFDEFIDLSIGEKFAEKEMISKIWEAKFDAEKMKELKKLFDPN